MPTTCDKWKETKREKGKANLVTDKMTKAKDDTANMTTTGIEATIAISKDTQKGDQKGKAKDPIDNMATANLKTIVAIVESQDTHTTRDCRKRMGDEKTKQASPTKKTKEVKQNVVQIDDELNLQFRQNVVSVTSTDPSSKPMRTSNMVQEQESSSSPPNEHAQLLNPHAPHAEDNTTETHGDDREYYIAIDGV
jgi:hypothetical protein